MTRTPRMPSAERRTAVGPVETLLQTGNRLTQQQFHALYELTPKHFRADLISGVVYVSSPLRRRHGRFHVRFASLIGAYEAETPGVEGFDNTSLIMDDENEPQPDVTLCIQAEFGGRTGSTADDYMTGKPELVCEVAESSIRLDLGDKRRAYREAGVLEYVVINIPDRMVHSFDLAKDVELKPDNDGIFRSRVFPGLWLDTKQFFDSTRVCLEVLKCGLRSPEHARFVKALAARRKKRKRSK